MLRNRLVAAVAVTALSANPALAGHLNIDAENAEVNGTKITFPAVKIDKPGFVVIHAIKNGQPVIPSSIGHTMVEAGDSTDVVVEVDSTDTEGYLAMLHYDTDGDGVYSFGESRTDVDGPALTAKKEPYVKPVKAGM